MSLECMDKELPTLLLSEAEIKLGETPEVRDEALKSLKILIKKEPNFQPLMENEFLVGFLRARRYNVEKAFRTLLKYYQLKRMYSGLVTGFKPSDVKKVLDMNIILLLKLESLNESPVAVMRLENFDESKATPLDLLSACYIAGVLGLRNANFQINGCVLICDTKGFTLKKMQQFLSPFLFQHYINGLKTFPSLESCMPLRVKAFHLINQTVYSKMLLNIGKKFLEESVRDRIFIHGSDLTSLHRDVSKEILPQELGGLRGPMDFREYNSYILSKEAYIEEMNKYGFVK